MESFIVNGFSLMLLSFSSYFILSWWVRYKGIENWVPYMNSITLAWILTSYTFLLPDLIKYTEQTRVKLVPLMLTGVVFVIFTIIGVWHNRKLYGPPPLGYALSIGFSATLLVASSNFNLLSPQHLLSFSILLSLVVITVTTMTYIKHIRSLSTTAIIYLLSSVALMSVLLVFRSEWERNFSIFVLCGTVMLQVVGYTVFYLEHIYKRNVVMVEEEEALLKSKQAEQNRRYFLENFDSVTGLRNQTNLQRKFLKWRQESKDQWLLMINITNFRQFNNTYGYLEGNQLLKQLADWLVALLADERSVFRFENDVFLLRFVGTSEAAQTFINDLQDGFKTKFAKRCEAAIMTLQVCITEVKPKESLDIHIQELSIVRATSPISYGGHFFDDLKMAEYHKQMHRQKLVREAVRDHQFTVYYQPKVCLSTGAVIGSEALVRMVQEGRIISPAEFMAYAEQSGLIVEIGYQVIEQVFSHLKAHAFDLPVSINLSAVQLFHSDFMTTLKHKVHEYGVNPAQIALEITETAVMKNFEEGIKQLKRIREMGFKVSLDDFGTGYSSFAYLMHMPIQEIKVDRSLVKDIVLDNKQQILMKTLVNLSRDLKVDLIIEGVETELQRDVILNLGGTIGQGYLFAPPLTLTDFKMKLQPEQHLVESLEA